MSLAPYHGPPPAYQGRALPAACELVHRQVRVRYRKALDGPEARQTAIRMVERLLLEPTHRAAWGWSEIALRTHPRKGVLVCEPDFRGDWSSELVGDITTTLTLERETRGVLNKYLREATPCSLRDRLLISSGALERADFMLHRHAAPRAGNSGWYIGPVLAEHMQGDAEPERPASAVLLPRHRKLVPLLSLPEGTLLVFRKGRLAEATVA